MPWLIKRRWWTLAGGLMLLLLGLVSSGPGTAVRNVLGPIGLVLVFLAVLGVLLEIPVALRARHEARRPPDSN
jgi:Na+/H+ antiporter NhaD/arsenite permease-like protein